MDAQRCQPLIRDVEIGAGSARLRGDLIVPDGARGIVLFAHGSGSSRHSPRNREVAAALQRAGLATVLLDLLTPEEDQRERQGALLRFDVALLAARLVAAIDWLSRDAQTAALPLGLFGASTGAAAALIAADDRAERVHAVVSRGGRPALAGASLPRVTAPVLLIVGGDDLVVLDLNRGAARLMHATHHLAVVPGATHLFEEPGAMEQVVRLARAWFVRHLVEAGAASGTSRAAS